MANLSKKLGFPLLKINCKECLFHFVKISAKINCKDCVLSKKVLKAPPYKKKVREQLHYFARKVHLIKVREL